MITQVKVGHKYINVSVAIVDGDGNATDPTTAEAYFYKISQIDGSLSLDTNIGGTGIVTLTKQNSQTGFYGAFIDITTFLETEYVVLYKIFANLVSTITVEYLSIDLSKKQIEEIKVKTDNLPIDPASETNAVTNKDEIIAKINDISLNLTDIETLIKRILGLVQENFRIISTTYNASGLLISATTKIYPTKADCDADTNPIATYLLTATYDVNNNCISYKMTKE